MDDVLCPRRRSALRPAVGRTGRREDELLSVQARVLFLAHECSASRSFRLTRRPRVTTVRRAPAAFHATRVTKAPARPPVGSRGVHHPEEPSAAHLKPGDTSCLFSGPRRRRWSLPPRSQRRVRLHSSVSHLLFNSALWGVGRNRGGTPTAASHRGGPSTLLRLEARVTMLREQLKLFQGEGGRPRLAVAQ